MPKPLYLPVPPEQFRSAPCDDRHAFGASEVKLDATNCKVWLNHRGSCSVQQFGNLAQARRKYAQIKKEIG